MMKDKIRNTILKYNMIPGGSRVVVALSGGSDSMSLLYVLDSLKEDLSFTLEAAHVNHCLRGEDADSDENFCREQCSKLGVKLSVLRADVSSIAKESGLSTEEAGRRVRYDFFASFGDGVIIATAHNLNDRAETFLFNFARGSSLKGLCSIPAVRDNIVRPLIDCSKEEINNFCKSNGIPYVTDKTNADVTYSRNRIRHNVITELKNINSAFENSASGCIESLNEDEKYLSALTDELFESSKTGSGFSIEKLVNAPVPLKKRAVARIIEYGTGLSPERKDIDELISSLEIYVNEGKGRTVQLPGNCFARTRAGIIEFPSENCNLPEKSEIKIGENKFGMFTITASREEKCSCIKESIPDADILYIDPAKVNGVLYADVRQTGDKLSLNSRGITKSLRKIQNEKHIAPEVRETSPVFRDDYGIVAACGCGVDSRVSVTSSTTGILKLVTEYKG